MSRFGANVNSVPPVTGRHFHLQTSSLYIEVSVTSCHWTNCISICTTSRHNMDSQHDQSVRHFGTFSSKNPAHAVQISHFVIICSKLLICECCALKTAQWLSHWCLGFQENIYTMDALCKDDNNGFFYSTIHLNEKY